MTTRYGFIGLGNLGAALAASLRRAGFELYVHDIDHKAAKAILAQGAVWSESPRALAQAGRVHRQSGEAEKPFDYSPAPAPSKARFARISCDELSPDAFTIA